MDSSSCLLLLPEKSYARLFQFNCSHYNGIYKWSILAVYFWIQKSHKLDCFNLIVLIVMVYIL